MKRVNLVGNYELYKVKPCELEDIAVFSKMAHINSPRCSSPIWYSVLKVRLAKGGHPIIVTHRNIVRWQFVEDQNGNVVLAYRESRIPALVPCIYMTRHDEKRGYFLKNVSKNMTSVDRHKRFYHDKAILNMEDF